MKNHFRWPGKGQPKMLALPFFRLYPGKQHGAGRTNNLVLALGASLTGEILSASKS
jgi:hypothetical protein